NAVDYLLKPISFDRLVDAVSRSERQRRLPTERLANDERLTRLLDWLESHQGTDSAATPAPSTSNYLRQLSIPFRDRILLVSVDRIASAEIAEGITRLHI